MAKTQSDARARYLETASSLLLTSSPPISAHLRLAGNELVHDGAQDSQVGSCAACGSIFVPGHSYKKAPSKRTREDRIQQARKGSKTVQLQCSRCDAITIFERPTRASVGSKVEHSTESKPASKDHLDDQAIAPPAKPTENASGQDPAQPPRKRARGKKPTLQSMLSEQQAARPTAETGFGLGLMDFMKT